MKRMPYALVTLLVWLILGIGGFYYSQLQHIPGSITAAVLPAFLLEITLYMAVGTESIRNRVVRTGSVLPLLVGVSAVIPYSVFTIPLHRFRPEAFLVIFVLAAIVSAWFLFAPKSMLSDLGLLTFMAVVYLMKVFVWAYPEPYPKVATSALGMLMWARTGYIAFLGVRQTPGVNFGLWPAAKDWGIGLKQYVFFLPFGAALGIWLQFLRVNPNPISERKLLGAIFTFFGVLWVLAPMEETFFRGVLQQNLVKTLKSAIAGLLAASIIFGSTHVFYPPFPNWRFAILASVAGVFYGLAFQQARSIRAAIVTHALVVATWRLFFF